MANTQSEGQGDLIRSTSGRLDEAEIIRGLSSQLVIYKMHHQQLANNPGFITQ